MQALTIVLGGVLLTVGAFTLGWIAAPRANSGEAPRQAGISKESARLHGRAAKILNRLAQVTDLDGAYAGDVLSEETKKQVTEWVADYREQLDKV